MSRKHQIVHLISFVAIMVSLFSPVLTLPVIAQDQQPEPEVTLTTGDEGSTPDAQAPAAPTNTDPVEGPPTQGDAPDTEQPPVQNDPPAQGDPPAEPALIAVVPAAPVITDATCSDGTVYAQTATTPVTDGVNYEIGAPDAAGIFTVTATLTDASVYTWADYGLDGWTVDGNQATSSGTLSLCPIPESEPEEPIEQEIPVESGEAGETGESSPEADTDSNASDISTPNTNARSSSMSPGEEPAPLLTYAISADKTHVDKGDYVTFTITISNTGNAPSENYAFLTDLSGSGNAFVHDPWDITQPPDGTSCNTTNDESHGFHCTATSPIPPQEEHTYTTRVKANPDATCGVVTTRGGGDTNTNGDQWADGSRYRESPVRLETTINCDPQLLNLSASVDIPDGGPLGLNQTFTYTATVTNTGSSADGDFTFMSQLPAGVILVDDSSIIHPEGTTCTPAVQSGATYISCSGTSVPLGEGNGLEFTFVVKAVDFISGVPTYVDCANGELSYIAAGTAGTWNPDALLVNLVTPINCVSNMVYTLEPLQSPVTPGDTIGFVHTVTNTGDTHITNFSPAGQPLPELPSGYAWTMTLEINGVPLTVIPPTMAVGPGETFRIILTSPPIPEDLTLPDTEWCTSWTHSAEMTVRFSTNETQTSSDSATVQVNCGSLLGLSATDHMTDAESIGLNQTFTYTATVTNLGPTVSGSFSFSIVLPPGLIPAGDFDERCSVTSAEFPVTFYCSGAALPAGPNSSTPFHIDVLAVDTERSTVCDTDFVQTQAFGDIGTWAEGQDEAYERTYVECISSIYYSITPLVSPAVPGGTIGFEIVVHNTGSTRITSFDTTDTPLPLLPDGEEWTLTPRLNGALIDPVNFPTSLAAGDILTITIESSEIPTDLTLPDNEWCTDWTVSSTLNARFSWGEDQQIPGSATVQVNCTGLSIEQDVSSERITPGGEVTYTITVTNHGNTTVSPLSVSHDSSETGTVFSNWRVTSGTALECGLNENDDPGCTFLTLAPQESAVITITGDAPLLPTAEQCAPVASQANFAYGETLPAARFNAGITPPYTQIDSEPVSTQIDCQPDVSVEMNGVLDLGANNRVDAGDTITYTLTVTNSGNMSLYDIVVTDDMADLEWDKDLSITELQPGETETFTATYTITQADIDAGELVSTASVSASLVPSPAMTRVQFVGLAQIAEPLPILPESVGNSITETTVLTQEPGILLEVSSAANTGDDDELNLNDTITYTFTVTNTGNVTLTNIDLIDELEGLVFTDGSTIASLAPGVEGTLTATYTVTQADVDAGSVVSCTDVTATDPGSNPVSETDVCVTNQVAQPVPVTPTPEPTATPEVPVTPEPTTPDVPATPDAPVTPAATEDAAQPVTKLPETGHGAGILTPILWLAATIGVLALGVGGATVRRSHTR